MVTIDEYRNRLERILGAQSSDGTSEDCERVQWSLTNEEFPVPGLLFIAFQEILGLTRIGPYEKLAWAFDLTFGGKRISISLEKFGLRLYAPATLNCDIITRALRKCCKMAERYLEPAIADQLNNAKVTLDNQYHRFECAYSFFRKAARQAYDTPPPEPVITETKYGRCTSHQPFLPMQHGGYLASAMLDAYFSKLEHILVLMAPFTGMDLTNGELQKLVGSTWGEKFRCLFHFATDGSAKTTYDELNRVKESFRNPASHGGFLKRGASFHFHSPAGALPVTLTKSDRDFEFRITPVPATTYEEICDVFDRSDEFLASSHLADAFAYVTSGLPVAVDDASRLECRIAMDSGCFRSFLLYKSAEHDRHMNMDY
jgi:hypothetical protein